MVTYYDIADFVIKYTIDELIAAGVHDGSQLVVKQGLRQIVNLSSSVNGL